MRILAVLTGAILATGALAASAHGGHRHHGHVAEQVRYETHRVCHRHGAFRHCHDYQVPVTVSQSHGGYNKHGRRYGDNVTYVVKPAHGRHHHRRHHDYKPSWYVEPVERTEHELNESVP